MALTAVAVLWVVSIPILMSLALNLDRNTRFAVDEPGWVRPEPLEAERSAVTVALQRAAPSQIVAPATVGLLTRIVEPGDTLTTGSVVMRVGGVDRVAALTSQPFERVLGPGSSGSDVEDLNRLLERLGLPSGRGETFGAATESGVRALARRLGAGDVTTFDPNWIVFLPTEPFVVASVEIAMATPAPPPGSIIARSTQRLVAAWVTDALAAPPSEPGSSAGVDEKAYPPRPVRESTTLVLGDLPLPLVEDRAHLAPAALDALSEALSGVEPTVEVEGVTAPPVDSWRLPAASILTAANGGSCVVVRRGDERPVIPVKVATTEGDTLYVVAPLRASDRVRVGVPADVDAANCG